MNQLEYVIEAIKNLPQSDEKAEFIKSLTEIFNIPVHGCDECKTSSIIYFEREDQLYCLFCDEPVMDFLYTECECGGQGMIEEVCDRDGICEEVAICLKCNKKIPKDSCFYDGETGYNFPEVLVDEDEETGEKVYEPVCPYCYRKLHDPEYI